MQIPIIIQSLSIMGLDAQQRFNSTQKGFIKMQVQQQGNNVGEEKTDKAFIKSSIKNFHAQANQWKSEHEKSQTFHEEFKRW